MNIAKLYTEMLNKEQGRRGYCMWKHERVNSISVKDYGMFMQRNKRRYYGRKNSEKKNR